MTSQNTEAGRALTDALNAGILALNTLQNPDATAPADADQLDAVTDSALDVLVRFRDALAMADRHGIPVPDAMVSSLDLDALTVSAWRLDSTLVTDRLAPVPVVRLEDAEALARASYASGVATATGDVRTERHGDDCPEVTGEVDVDTCPGCATDPADTPWTVIGFYEDGDPEPVVVGVVPGNVNVVGDGDVDAFADYVTALDADEAVKVALADRVGE